MDFDQIATMQSTGGFGGSPEAEGFGEFADLTDGKTSEICDISASGQIAGFGVSGGQDQDFSPLPQQPPQQPPQGLLQQEMSRVG